MEGHSNVDAEFYEYLRSQGLEGDQRLLALPSANKQLMLSQSRRMSTLTLTQTPPQTQTQAGSRPASPAPSVDEAAPRGLFALFARKPSASNPRRASAAPGASGSSGSSSSSLGAAPDESLTAKFEAVLTTLHVTGKTREQVLNMFVRAKVADQLVILEKYTKQIASSVAAASPRPLSPDRGSEHSQGGLVRRPSSKPSPAPYNSSTYSSVNSLNPAPIEGYEWVDHLHGSALDKQFEKVLIAMRLTGYSKSTVMMSTQTSGKRLMIKQHYSQHNLPPPNDLPEDQLASSPSSPTPSTSSSFSRQNSNLELFRVDDASGLPKTVDFYVSNFMDQSLSGKSLLRILATLRVQLTLGASPHFLQQFHTTKVFVPNCSQSFTGLESLQQILSRFNNNKSSQYGASAIKWFRTYADNSTVRPDEIRLEILECLSKFEPSHVTASTNLVSELIALLTATPEDTAHLTEHLTMRTHAAQVGGYVCLDGDEGLELVRESLPADLGALVFTLVDPFSKTYSSKAIQSIPAAIDESIPNEVDISVLWQFRVALLEFIVALVGAYDDVGARMKLRKAFENAGLGHVLTGLCAKAETISVQVSGEEDAQFLELVKVFEEGKAEDLLDLRENGTGERPSISNKSPQEIMDSTLNILKSLPSEAALAGTLLLEHASILISSFQNSSQQQKNAEVNPEDLLILSERLTYVTSIAASVPSSGNDNWLALSQSLIAAIESATGLSLAPVESTSAVNLNKKLLQEVDELKVQLALAKSLEDDYRQKTADLQEVYESTKREAAAVVSTPAYNEAESNKDEEIRVLRERLAAMTVERDEAVRLAATQSTAQNATGRKATKMPKILRSGTVVVLPKLETKPTCGSLQLKNLEWTKVQDNKVYSSVWGDVVENTYIIGDAAYSNSILDAPELSTLPTLFAKPDEQTSSFAITPFSKKVILLEDKRSRQIEILLRSLRGPAPEYIRLTRQQIRDGITTMSETVLTLDNLTILIQIVPTTQETELVNSFQGNPDILADAEKFIRTISTIPRLKQRLECIIFQKRLIQEIVEMKPDLSLIAKAAKALVSSEKFFKVLQTVLVIGNFVNGNSFRGGAYGFEFESLLQLKETKAVDACKLRDRAPTLLHYLARRLEETDSDLLADLKSEIGVVEMASRVSIQALFDSIQELEAGFNKVKTEITITESLGQEGDTPFLESMRQFIGQKEPLLTQLCVSSDNVAVDVQNLVEYFGQDLKQDTTSAPPTISNTPSIVFTGEHIFKTVWKFLESLQRAANDNKTVDEKALLINRNENPYSRKPQLTPLQRAVLEKMARLKAVEGQKPFALRGMTLGRSKKRPVYVPETEEEAVGGGAAAMGAAAGTVTADSKPVEAVVSPLKTALKNRQTLRRITKHVSVANMLKAAGKKSVGGSDEDQDEKTGKVVVEGIHEVLGRYSESA
ncbi:hypothetical protein BDR26DRAFT_853582 [Obelidium mucronatum]|nr:hypothetical protein BDR26DRAFT_853582 [Obelidium mucronatum]